MKTRLRGVLRRVLCGLTAVAVGAPLYAAAEAVTVTPAAGVLQGVRSEDVDTFKGVPYALAPTGRLRWRPPQAAARWSGVRNADAFGASCEQTYGSSAIPTRNIPVSEDCLTLNIWAPARRAGGRNAAPVMVWIHGGAFVTGSGSDPAYDGAAFAKRGVILVTFNYRLGRFGFFAHPALSAEHREEPKGDYGLMDMIAVLRWVRTNIAVFGGDPDRVTVFGESAGAVAINDLMVAPPARGLFTRAIVESGGGREIALPLHADGDTPSAESLGVAFARKLGLPDATAATLRALTPRQILEAGDPDMVKGGEGSTIADGKILPVGSREGFARGMEAPIPYVVGSNGLELPVPKSMLEATLARMPDVTSPQLDEIARAYPSREVFESHAATDILFTEPAARNAALHARHGYPTWLYRFSLVPVAGRGVLPGAVHTSEIYYVFGTLGVYPHVPTGASDVAQSAAVNAYWARFAATGDPNGAGAPFWRRYDAERDQLMNFTDTGPRMEPVPLRSMLDAIAASYRKVARADATVDSAIPRR